MSLWRAPEPPPARWRLRSSANRMRYMVRRHRRLRSRRVPPSASQCVLAWSSLRSRFAWTPVLQRSPSAAGRRGIVGIGCVEYVACEATFCGTGLWQGLDGSPALLFRRGFARFAMSRGSRLSPRSREHFRAGATGSDALRGTRKPSAGRLSVGRGRPLSSSRSRFRLRTGLCRPLGADTPRDAELRGDLAGSRLRAERKYVKRIHARDTGKARREFAR